MTKEDFIDQMKTLRYIMNQAGELRTRSGASNVLFEIANEIHMAAWEVLDRLWTAADCAPRAEWEEVKCKSLTYTQV